MAGLQVGSIVAKIGANTQQFVSEIGAAGKSLSSFARTADGAQAELRTLEVRAKALAAGLKSVGTGLSTLVTLPLLAAGAGFLKVAGDAEEMESKFTVAFGDSADAARAWADDFARVRNRGAVSTRGLLADARLLVEGFGVTGLEGDALAQRMIERATDLGSFLNMTNENVLMKMSSAFRGQHDTVSALGFQINEQVLDAQAAVMGLGDSFRDLSERNKLLVRSQIILFSEVGADGDAVRTADSFTNSLKGLQGAFHDLSVSLGTELLPGATRLLQIAKGLVDGFGGLSESTRRNIVVFGAFAAILGPLLFVIATLINAFFTVKTAITAAGVAIKGFSMAATITKISAMIGSLKMLAVAAKVAAAAKVALGVVLAASKIGLVVLAVITLVRVLGALRPAFAIVLRFFQESVPAAVRGLAQLITNSFSRIGAALVAPFRAAGQGVVSALSGVLNFFTVTLPRAVSGLVVLFSTGLRGAISTLFEPLRRLTTLSGTFRDVWSSLRDFFAVTLPAAFSSFITFVSSPLRALSGLLAGPLDLVSRIGGAVSNLGSGIIGGRGAQTQGINNVTINAGNVDRVNADAIGNRIAGAINRGSISALR